MDNQKRKVKRLRVHMICGHVHRLTNYGDMDYVIKTLENSEVYGGTSSGYFCYTPTDDIKALIPYQSISFVEFEYEG